MKKTILITLATMTFLATQAQAQWAGTLHVNRVAPANNDTAMIVLDVIPAGACSYFGYSFIVDLSTKGGQNIYDALTLSLVLNKAIDIWYTESSVPGADYTNGCEPATMAVINQVSLIK